MPGGIRISPITHRQITHRQITHRQITHRQITHRPVSTATPGWALLCPSGPPTRVISGRVTPGFLACLMVQGA